MESRKLQRVNINQSYENDVDIIRCHLCRTWRLNNYSQVGAFGRVDEAVPGGKPPAGKGDSLSSWHVSHFCACVTFSKVRHGDSVTKPDYNYYYRC